MIRMGAAAALMALSSLGPAFAADMPTAMATHDDPRRSVTVIGNGEVLATPDRARLSMSVEVTRPVLKDAQEEANRTVRDFLSQAHSLGTRDEDISTAALSIRADYEYSNSNGTQVRRFVGYHVSREIDVVVRDLDHVGDYLKRATDCGINNLAEPQLESSKAEDWRQQALAAAAVNARNKAQLLATTLGVKLGTVRRIEASSDETTPRPPRPFMAMARTADSDSGNAEMGWAAGQLRFTATLTADFDLIAP